MQKWARLTSCLMPHDAGILGILYMNERCSAHRF